jgi:hypothetical protein
MNEFTFDEIVRQEGMSTDEPPPIDPPPTRRPPTRKEPPRRKPPAPRRDPGRRRPPVHEPPSKEPSRREPPLPPGEPPPETILVATFPHGGPLAFPNGGQARVEHEMDVVAGLHQSKTAR